METIKNTLERAIQNAQARAENQAKVYRFDIFKGVEDSEGKVQKIRSVGSAQLLEGAKTYTVYLKTLLKDVFFLLPEQKRMTRGDYVILTREPSQTAGRKYFWNNIGECYLLDGANAGLMRLSFDLFGAEDIYMSLHPINREAQESAAA
jgi:hypothetical protein